MIEEYLITDCLLLTRPHLDCRGVEEAPHHVLTAAVGRQVEWSETSLTGQFSHQALGLGCGDLAGRLQLLQFSLLYTLTSDFTLGGTCLISSLTMSSSP